MLTQKQLNFWNSNGLVKLDKFYDANMISQMKRWVSELAHLPQTPGKWMHYYERDNDSNNNILCRIENFVDYHKELSEIIYNKRVLDILEQLFHDSPVLFKDKINFKLPRGNGYTPHQDEPAYAMFDQSIHITFMICIDDATMENGCLDFASGRHKEGIFTQDRYGNINKAIVAQMNWKSYPCLAGDVMFFDSYVPHRSGQNISTSSRMALFATYNKLSEQDKRIEYFKVKRQFFPPENERDPAKNYLTNNPFNLGNPIK